MAWTCMGNYLASALAVWAPCFLKTRVGENSPSRWPTMFSVTKTGLNILPLWTLKVRPTKSGVIIERRDQVLIGVLDLASLAFWIFSSKWPSTNGPFLIERPIETKRIDGLMEWWSHGFVDCGMMAERLLSSNNPMIQ